MYNALAVAKINAFNYYRNLDSLGSVVSPFCHQSCATLSSHFGCSGFNHKATLGSFLMDDGHTLGQFQLFVHLPNKVAPTRPR